MTGRRGNCDPESSQITGRTFRLSCLAETVHPRIERSEWVGLSANSSLAESPAQFPTVSLSESSCMCITEVVGSAPLIMSSAMSGGHVAFFAQGLADGRERGDAARSQSRDRRSRRQKRPQERIGPASLSAVMTPAAIRSDPHSTPSACNLRARATSRVAW